MAGLLRLSAIFLFVSICAKAVTAQPTCDVVDDASLQYFYREIVFAGSEFSTWQEGTNCCTWQGVTCDSNGNVIILDIEHIDQNPPYPVGPLYYIGTSIPGLQNLVSLTMKNVAFNGGIPSSWGTLTTIKVLNLASSNIVGPMPAELCNLSQMTNFSMADNAMTGTLPDCMKTPFATFPSLTYFKSVEITSAES